MRALVFIGPGRMELEERADPVPARGDVVVAVRAAGICGSDVHGYAGRTGRRAPGIVMGHEASGEVVDVGADVSELRPGDRVALRSILGCGICPECRAGSPNRCPTRHGLGIHIDGAYADRVCVPERLAVRLVDGTTFRDGSLIEPLAVAIHAVNRTPTESGDTAVVIGAGAIGLLIVLALHDAGVDRVVVTDRDAHRLSVARAFGAEQAIDVASVDPVAAVREATGGHGADVVFEAVGVPVSAGQSLAFVRPGGNVTWVGNSAPRVEIGMQDLVTGEITLRGAYGEAGEFMMAATAIAEGRIAVSPLIERVEPLEAGPRVFEELAAGRLDAVKVVLEPEPQP